MTLPTTRLWHGMWELLVGIGVELDATLVQIPPMPKPEVVEEVSLSYWEQALGNPVVAKTIIEVAGVAKTSAELSNLILSRVVYEAM